MCLQVTELITISVCKPLVYGPYSIKLTIPKPTNLSHNTIRGYGRNIRSPLLYYIMCSDSTEHLPCANAFAYPITTAYPTLSFISRTKETLRLRKGKVKAFTSYCEFRLRPSPSRCLRRTASYSYHCRNSSTPVLYPCR